MKVEFTSGIFKDERIVLDGLTVICGENNTGKSCVAYDTYQYIKNISKDCFLTMDSRVSYCPKLLNPFLVSEINERNPEIMDMLESILNGHEYLTSDPYEFQVDDDKFYSKMSSYSSSANSVADFYIYLKRFAVRNGVYIIDAPEISLHPKSQRKMARILAMLVNAGVKVLVTTNSDYIIREFNTLIMLKNKKVRGLSDEYGYSKNEILNPKCVNCYVTDNGKLVKMNVSCKYGIEVTSFDETIEEVNKIQQQLLYDLA